MPIGDLPGHVEDILFALEEHLPEAQLPHLMRLRGFMLAQQRELEQIRASVDRAAAAYERAAGSLGMER